MFKDGSIPFFQTGEALFSSGSWEQVLGQMI